jgi:hypothetical protein
MILGLHYPAVVVVAVVVLVVVLVVIMVFVPVSGMLIVLELALAVVVEFAVVPALENTGIRLQIVVLVDYPQVVSLLLIG